MRSIQEGIYYTKGSRPGQSLGIVFLRTKKISKASEIGKVIFNIWNACDSLKKGINPEFQNSDLSYAKHYQDLTILIGYGPKIFDLIGSFKSRPKMFSDLGFSEPMRGGGSIFVHSDLSYHENITENHAANDDIVIQFISDSADVTKQCIVETLRVISQGSKDQIDSPNVSITRSYDGFRRRDDRNWMGFHDGLSNIKHEERKEVIAINGSQVQAEDMWTVEGTFMCFIRMYIDLMRWWKVERNEQELMVGRDKVTGCPLVGINAKTRKNILIKGCPISGTKVVTEEGNEIFRNHPRYGYQLLPAGVTDKPLVYSHISEARKFGVENPTQREKYQIFRQGYEFLEDIESYSEIRAGLNFISFQDSPIRLFNTLANIKDINEINSKISWNTQKNTDKKQDHPVLSFNSYFRVSAAGIFFIPPKNTQEIFPGESIFFTPNEIKNEYGIRKY